MPGDNIIIGSRPNIIQVIGAVYSPGSYQFIPGATLRDYIKIAGGYTDKC